MMNCGRPTEDRRTVQHAKLLSISSPLYILFSTLAKFSLFLCMATMMVRPARAFVTKPIIGNSAILSNSRGLARKVRGVKVPSRWMDKITTDTSPSSSTWGSMLSSLFAGFGETEVDPGNVKGTKLKILKYPHPQLRTDNGEISEFDDNLKKLASEMLLVMRAADGIGLAAPQVGINKRLMVFNDKADDGKSDMVLCNPVIVEMSEDTDVREEGCLSFPQINGDVTRSIWIDVEYTDLMGSKTRKKFEGLAARIFQHEYDHLDKVLFIDRLEEKDFAMNKKRLDKYVKKYGAGAMP